MQQAYFDNYAVEYDDHFTHSLIGKRQRVIVHEYLCKVANKNSCVLEVNCGTGEDALLLAQIFGKVVCTDISREMINCCKEKIKTLQNTEARISSIADLRENVKENYHFVFSNFGGLNCLNKSELKKFAATCEDLTKDRSELLFVVMGRKCIWERVYFKLKGAKEKALRRTSPEGVDTTINGSDFKTFYYSPHEIKELFHPAFEVIKYKPVGLFIPPSYLNPFFGKHRVLFSILSVLEKSIGNISLFSDYADHYLIHLKRK